ncbi:MAG: cysteine--tRNA ligase [Candidatus Vogelbacteria bacterium]|nr:cysteine--tRNA ligase [Candidatus Vogelbacteria bacterium]
MDLRLYNSLSRRLETFTPLNAPRVKMYSCGPTVYDYAHLGNWRAFVTADLLRRVLDYNNLQTDWVMNITDVDDKTIAASQKTGQTLVNFTKFYEQAFRADLEKLNISQPKLVKATDYVPEMIKLVEELLKQNIAYKTADGIYFDIKKFPNYGRFREVIPKEDNNFALWKFWKPEDGPIKWPAPFGGGRPGWHIECSAMSMKELGETFDIHTGGGDLMFPHHENELAQSEAVSSKVLAKYWIHNNFLNVGGEKMSKSLNNIYTLQDLEKKNITPLAYRYWLLTAHYRTLVNFTWEAVAGAQTTLNKIYNRVRALETEAGEGEVDQTYRDKFLSAINNDLNLPEALAVTWELLNDDNLKPSTSLAILFDFDRVFDLGLAAIKPLKIPPEVQVLVNKRETARQNQNWPEADTFRQEIEKFGFHVNDTNFGPEIKVL